MAKNGMKTSLDPFLDTFKQNCQKKVKSTSKRTALACLRVQPGQLSQYGMVLKGVWLVHASEL